MLSLLSRLSSQLYTRLNFVCDAGYSQHDVMCFKKQHGQKYRLAALNEVRENTITNGKNQGTLLFMLVRQLRFFPSRALISLLLPTTLQKEIMNFQWFPRPQTRVIASPSKNSFLEKFSPFLFQMLYVL